MARPRRQPSRIRIALAAAIAAVLATALGGGAATASAAAAAPAGAGATVVAERRVDDRLRELTVRTATLASETRVRVLLPRGYARATQRRFPVLYLLHGAGGSYADWTDSGSAERAVGGAKLIVVMPDGGPAGWYTDWLNGGTGGPPEWETYHVRRLIPLVDRRYRTVARRRGRAIAGLSMGGFGAFSYAARHPGLFTAAASYSGGLDLNAELFGQPAGEIAVDGSLGLAGDPGITSTTLFGDFESENIRWRGHNPPDLAANLRGLELAMYTGNGQPGGPFGPAGSDLIEIGAHLMNVNMHERLERLGIAHIWDDYGPGGHTWPYWARDLDETVPWLMDRFAHPRGAPARITFTAIERSYAAYGWHVRLRRPNVEFSTLGHAGRRGFTLTGSGRASVKTPTRYRPGARYVARIARTDEVGIAGRRAATRERRIRADRSGRLRIGFRLAPTNPHDEGSPQAEAAGPPHRATVRVGIARLRGHLGPHPSSG